MKLKALAQDFLAARLTSLLDEATVTGFFVEAAIEYAGWGDLAALQTRPNLDGETRLTLSEWAVIKPLAYLLCEKETALMHELSKLVSHEPAGRSSSEIENDITQFRQEYFRQWAFAYPCATI